MKLYLIVVGVSIVIVSCLNWLIGGLVFWTALGQTLLLTLYAFLLNVVATVLMGKCLPQKAYSERCQFYKVSKAEYNFYKKINIAAWKDYILELGALSGFSKKNLANPNDPKYIERFIFELNKGMLVHLVSFLACFIVLAIPSPSYWGLNVPVTAIGAILNLAPLMVLRYNKPRMQILLKRLRKQQPKTTATEEQ